ncbi:MAG TPA: YceI family protein [Rhodanobacteraceae bacterium]|nr:YceI family protein [Rhodanobacteraceae bacterium]
MKSAILFAALLGGAASAAAAPVHYTLDPPHTQVIFSWDHLGFSHPSGEFGQVQGTLVYDADATSKSSVRVSIPVKSLDTHVPALDKELLGPKFLDAEKFPTITFISTQVRPAGSNQFVVEGDLTVHGVTHPVTLNVTLNKAGSYPMIDAPALGFGATAKFNRSEFGVREGIPMVGDALQVTISAEAIEAHAWQTKVLPLEQSAGAQ